MILTPSISADHLSRVLCQYQQFPVFMENIIREVRCWKARSEKYQTIHQNIYETTFESCQILRVAPSKGSMPWMFEGMANNVKPMWAVMVGDQVLGETLGFVWDTTVALNDISVHEITSVKCKRWSTWAMLNSNFRMEDRKGPVERMRLLGTTRLWPEQVEKAGSDLPFLKMLTP